MKLPDRSENDKIEDNTPSSQEKGTFFYKPPRSTKKMTGETQILDDTPISFSLAGQERKIRTAYGSESVKASSAGSDWYPKTLPKKNTIVS